MCRDCKHNLELYINDGSCAQNLLTKMIYMWEQRERITEHILSKGRIQVSFPECSFPNKSTLLALIEAEKPI
jgi:hypothetical protein